jgi:hypothetical protein
MRIDILLFKNLEFKNGIGHKVKITDIPVLLPGDPNYFMVTARLEMLMNHVYRKTDSPVNCSFKDYLAAVLRWPDYQKMFLEEHLKSNA